MPLERDLILNLDYLKCLNTAQLLEFLEDEKRMRETVRHNSKLQHLQRCKKILMASNCWLAEKNLAHQPHLNNSKKLLAEKYQILSKTVSSVQCKQRKLEILQKKLRLQTFHELLKEKTNHSLSQSENLWQKFTEGKLLLKDFVESVQSSQMLCHLRLFQAEKIHNIIIHTQIYNQDADFCYFGDHPDYQHSLTTINVFSGTATVIFLPGFQSPHLPPILHLPPLKHVDTCSILTSKNESSKENRRWPQRHAALQPLDTIQSNIYQAPK